MYENEVRDRFLRPLMIFGLIIFGALLTFTSIKLMIEANEPKSGVIVSLNHEPEYTVDSFRCSMYDIKGFCIKKVPVIERYPTTWTVIYEDEAGEMGDDPITEEQYNTYSVGGYYVNGS